MTKQQEKINEYLTQGFTEFVTNVKGIKIFHHTNAYHTIVVFYGSSALEKVEQYWANENNKILERVNALIKEHSEKMDQKEKEKIQKKQQRLEHFNNLKVNDLYIIQFGVVKRFFKVVDIKSVTKIGVIELEPERTVINSFSGSFLVTENSKEFRHVMYFSLTHNNSLRDVFRKEAFKSEYNLKHYYEIPH